LVAQVKQLRSELQGALGDNRQHKVENERLRARESAIDQRIQQALDGERRRLEQERGQLAGERQVTQGLLQELQQRLDGLAARNSPDLPIGLGLEEGDAAAFGGAGLRWIEPDDVAGDTQSGPRARLSALLPGGFGSVAPERADAIESLSAVAGRATQAVGDSARAVYTLPA